MQAGAQIGQATAPRSADVEDSTASAFIFYGLSLKAAANAKK